MTLWQRTFLLFLVICVGCSAQSDSPDLHRRIENQVRSFYNIPADVKVNISPTKASEFANYDALTITFEGAEKKQSYDFLLSRDGKTLIRMTRMDLTKDPYAEVMKKIDVSGRPTRGNKNAKVVAINYDDFECPFCSRMHETLFPRLFQEYGDRVLFIYKDYPLAEIHPWAIHAAVNANCLAAQSNDAYWDFADYIHANQKEVNGEKGSAAQFGALDRITLLQGQKRGLDIVKLQSCIKQQDDTAVKASMQEGDKLGLSATPTMFINGQQIEGALPISDVRAVLDRALEQAGVSPPPHPAEAPSAGKSPSPSL